MKMFGCFDLVENVFLVVMYGIYGGDVWKLSV